MEHQGRLFGLAVPVSSLALALALIGCDRRGADVAGFSGAVDSDSPPATTDDTSGGLPQPGSTSADPESTGDGLCHRDSDCEGSAHGPHCDESTGACGGECIPATTRPCYSGAAGTEGVGQCAAGVQTCLPSATWGPWCEGEMLPGADDCNDNGVDDDCDGLIDDSDLDGDGYGACAADCCDAPDKCSGAELVNPGAFEVVGNGIDDDCDGSMDEVEPTCDAGLQSGSGNAEHYARAMELCQFTSESPADPKDRVWGVIDARFSLADGAGTPLAVQRSLRPQFGDIIRPESGANMAVLSSGHAAAPGDNDPVFAPFQSGANLASESPAPADWLAANGGKFPNPANCEEPWNTDAHDPIMLTLRVRVPTNAHSFTMRMQFFSAEYPEWVCTPFNDFFLALVDSAATTNPADKNIAIYDDGATSWPVGVNLVMVADGLFSQCDNGPMGCRASLNASYAGCLGTALLEGTGFDQTGTTCEQSRGPVGGGTGWLRMSGNVEPGETMEIRFAIWDSSGFIYDSLVLLDDWQWSLDAATVGIAPG